MKEKTCKQNIVYIQDIYRIDLFCHDYKLTIEIDENGRSDRNIDYQKKKTKFLVVSFLKLTLEKKNLDILEIAVKYLDTSNNQLKNPNN